jgi:hypothetical protein
MGVLPPLLEKPRKRGFSVLGTPIARRYSCPTRVDPELIGWGEMTIDVVDVEDVHVAIEWAARRLDANAGPYSGRGWPRPRSEYVLYAKVPGENRFLQIAGWDPRATCRATT